MGLKERSDIGQGVCGSAGRKRRHFMGHVQRTQSSLVSGECSWVSQILSIQAPGPRAYVQSTGGASESPGTTSGMPKKDVRVCKGNNGWGR
jgi:hypothetical protein